MNILANEKDIHLLDIEELSTLVDDTQSDVMCEALMIMSACSGFKCLQCMLIICMMAMGPSERQQTGG